MLLESKYKRNWTIFQKEFLFYIKVGREGRDLGFKDYVETFTATIFPKASRGANGSKNRKWGMKSANIFIFTN